MPRRCLVCDHPEKEAIDQALLLGKLPITAIAATYQLPRKSIARHRDKHLPETLALAEQANRVAQADDLLGQVQGLRLEAHAIKDSALKDGEYRTALYGIRELLRIVELLARLKVTLLEQQRASEQHEPIRVREVVMLHRIEDPRVQSYDAPAGSFTVVVSRQGWYDFQSWERRCGLAGPGVNVPPRLAYDNSDWGGGDGDEQVSKESGRPQDSEPDWL